MHQGGYCACSADRVDSVHVIPTVLRCFNGLLFLLSYPGDFVSRPLPQGSPFTFWLLICTQLPRCVTLKKLLTQFSAHPSIKCQNRLDYPWSLTQLFCAKIVKFSLLPLVWCNLHSLQKAAPETRAFVEVVYFGLLDTMVYECRV